MSVEDAVVHTIKHLGDGGSCCLDVLAREWPGVDLSPVIARLLDTARIVVAPGCCSHCSSVLYRVIG